MTEDSINWVTIKVPEEVRDEARDDDRTYGEIMQAGLGTHPVESDVPVDEIAEELKAEIDSLTFSGAVFEEEAERIMDRIDDLQSQVPKDVAEELSNGR